MRSQRKEIEKKPKLNYSYVNDPHVVSKFMKEFNDCIASFGIEINDKTDDCELDFTTMKQIMSRMGFTHTGAVAEAEKNQYEKMILDIFTSLDGENRNMVKIGGLKKMIAGIFNISLELGDSEESNRLHNEYKLLYLLRKSHVERPSTQQTGMVNRPLQSKVFERRHQSFVEFADSLIQSGLRREVQLNKRKHDKEVEEVLRCTFVPRINQSYVSEKKSGSARKVVHTVSSSVEKCKELYELAKHKKVYSAIPMKEEKLPAECTFVPKIIKASPLRPSTQVDAEVPMADKVLERMRKAREERERVRKMLERTTDGEPMKFDLDRNKYVVLSSSKESRKKQTPSTIKQDSKEGIKTVVETLTPIKLNNELPLIEDPSSEKRNVILNIEVNLGERMEKIMAYEGDTAEVLARTFAEKHGIFFVFFKVNNRSGH